MGGEAIDERTEPIVASEPSALLSNRLWVSIGRVNGRTGASADTPRLAYRFGIRSWSDSGGAEDILNKLELDAEADIAGRTGVTIGGCCNISRGRSKLVRSSPALFIFRSSRSGGKPESLVRRDVFCEVNPSLVAPIRRRVLAL